MSYPCHTHVVFQRRLGDFEKDGSAQCRKACRQVEEGGAGHDLWEDTWHSGKSGTTSSTSAPRFTIINSDFQHRFGYPKYPINFTFNWLGNPEIQHVWSQLFGNETERGLEHRGTRLQVWPEWRKMASAPAVGLVYRECLLQLGRMFGMFGMFGSYVCLKLGNAQGKWWPT